MRKYKRFRFHKTPRLAVLTGAGSGSVELFVHWQYNWEVLRSPDGRRCEWKGSRTRLREAGGETPPAYSPLGKDQHDPHPWPSPARQRLVASVPHARWKQHDVGGGLALRRPCRTLRVRRCHQRLPVPGMGDTVPRADSAAWRSSCSTTWAATKAFVRRAIRDARSAHLLFLPPYGPDLNPIEMVFAKLKTLLRKADERSVAAVWHRIGALLQQFSPAECANLSGTQALTKTDPGTV